MIAHTLTDIFPELEKRKGFFVIIDPDEREVWLEPDQQHVNHLEQLVESREYLTSILIGGSTGVCEGSLDEAIKKLTDKGYPKERVGIVPCNHTTFSKHANYASFLVCINSTIPYFHFDFLLQSIDKMQDYGIKVIPTAYLLAHTADKTTVGHVLKPDLITDYKSATKYSKMANLLGFRTLSLEGGSGADYPVPSDIIKACRDNFDGMITVGGGIESPEHASYILKSGANVIIIGNVVEKSKEPKKLIKNIYDVVVDY